MYKMFEKVGGVGQEGCRRRNNHPKSNPVVKVEPSTNMSKYTITSRQLPKQTKNSFSRIAFFEISRSKVHDRGCGSGIKDLHKLERKKI